MSILTSLEGSAHQVKSGRRGFQEGPLWRSGGSRLTLPSGCCVDGLSPFGPHLEWVLREHSDGVRVRFQAVKVPIFFGFPVESPTKKANHLKALLRGISLSGYGSERFQVRLRRLSEYGSVAYLVERPTRETRAEQYSDTVLNTSYVETCSFWSAFNEDAIEGRVGQARTGGTRVRPLLRNMVHPSSRYHALFRETQTCLWKMAESIASLCCDSYDIRCVFAQAFL